MKKLMIAICAGIAAVNVLAQETTSQQATPAVVAQPTARDVAKQPAVEELLLEEDGVSLVTAPDGSFQIFVRGTGNYQFIDNDAERDARRLAKLNAQRNLAEYIKTKVVGSVGVDEMRKQSRMLSGNGIVQETLTSQERMEEIKDVITANTEAVLSGLVTVESRKVPVPGTTRGSIQITMVYSSKTAKAAAWVGKKLQDHQAELQINEVKNEARVNAARQAAQNEANGASAQGSSAPAPVAVAPVGGGTPRASGAFVPVNKAERRVNKTEY